MTLFLIMSSLSLAQRNIEQQRMRMNNVLDIGATSPTGGGSQNKVILEFPNNQTLEFNKTDGDDVYSFSMGQNINGGKLPYDFEVSTINKTTG